MLQVYCSKCKPDPLFPCRFVQLWSKSRRRLKKQLEDAKAQLKSSEERRIAAEERADRLEAELKDARTKSPVGKRPPK